MCATWQSSQVLVFIVEYKRKNAHCDSSVVVVLGPAEPKSANDDIMIQQCLCAPRSRFGSKCHDRNIRMLFPYLTTGNSSSSFGAAVATSATDDNKQKLRGCDFYD